MSFKIKNINVKNLGPIEELNWDLADINLVFGHNEKGKSYLVEFFIRSLFKVKNWSGLRSQQGKGKINVETSQGEEVSFSPSSDQKLEDLLSESHVGLPPDFSKLLVLRGSDVKLGSDGENDKQMLRKFLSHKELLNEIIKPMNKSVINAEITGYTINASNLGDISKRQDLKKELDHIQQLFLEVEDKYLSGDLYQLEEKKETLQKQQRQIEQAKRYSAYYLSQEIDHEQQEIDKFDQKKIEQIKVDINTWKRSVASANGQQKKIDKLEKKTKNYTWLKQAAKHYQEFSRDVDGSKPNQIVFGFMLVALISAGGAFLFNINLLGIIMLAAAIGLAIFDRVSQRKSSIDDTPKRELLKLKQDFKNRLDRSLTSLATLENEQQQLEADYQKLQGLKSNRGDTVNALANQKIEIENSIEELFGEKITSDQWKTRLRQLLDKQEELKDKLKNYELKLSKLNIPAKEYLTKKPDLDYQPDQEVKINKQLEKASQAIKNKENSLETLKQRVCDATGKSFSLDWNQLIEALADKKEQVESNYKQLTAQIIAQKNVSDVIKELLAEEDQKIDQVLDSDIIQDLLPQVTGGYQDIELRNDTLYVSDSFSSFPVSEISDGAQEQVFLTLRIALASQWFKDDKLFLILDDAFIHSDTNRRKELVKSVIKLGEAGWQIICLSFDERIKQLFAQNSEDYQLLDLNKGSK
ncbi:MAG: hypothetical protein U9O78_00790 [Patescibacteria group bacterium]|nr:hypothetical protein [Patescibacteria group bacterium]